MLDVFYRDVLPSRGHYALFRPQGLRHTWCSDQADLAQKTLALSGAPDLYFALASFATPTKREAANATHLRCLFLDIDAGPEKYAKHGDRVYPTLREALTALVTWCQTTGLAATQVVSSGAGLHAYFALREDAPVAEWKPVADGFKAMALAQGLRIDPSVTSDAARVLRPVGSLHNNGATVRSLMRLEGAVHDLATIQALVAPYAPKPVATRRRGGINDDILSAPLGPPKTLAKIATRCAAMASVMSARGDATEPLWRAMLGVIKHTVEGEEAAHLYSQGHPEYDAAQTQAKFDRWAAGPTTCAVFEQEDPQSCRNCAYRGKIKSPIVLGEMTAPQEEAHRETHQAAAQDAQSDESVPTPAPAAATPPAPAPFSDDGAEPSGLENTAAPQGKGASGAWTGHLPEGTFVVRTTGGLAMVMTHSVMRENAAGDKVRIQLDTPFSNVVFWFESWAVGTTDADQALACYCVWDVERKEVTRFTFPTFWAAKPDTLLAGLARQNIQVYPTTLESKNCMVNYVKDALEKIREMGKRHKISDRFGTTYDTGGNVVVAQGSHVIAGDGTISEAVVHEKLRQRGMAYKVPLPHNTRGRWDASVWDSHVMPRAQRHIAYMREFYGDPNFNPYQLAIMLAWASPMMAFITGTYRPGTNLPGIGLTVSLYSPRSGIGKTAALHAAALAFGHPSDICLQLDRNSATGNARQALLLQSGTMPSFMDEMEDVDPADLASLISAVGNGSSKSRLTKDLAVVGGVTTALINVMTTNRSHRDIVSSDRTESTAVQMRMLEIDCSSVEPVDAHRAALETQARATLHDCAGAVGAVIHRQMTRLGAEGLNQLGLECAAKAREMLDGKQDGRFLWRALGAMLAVRRMLKAAGLQVFALETLVAEFKHWQDQGYEFASERLLPSDGPALMAMFLSDIFGHTVVTERETQRHGVNPKDIDVPMNDRMPERVYARAVLNTGAIYVKMSAFSDWCERRKLGATHALRKCRAAGLFEQSDPLQPRSIAHRFDLLKGTKYSTGVRDNVFKVIVARLPGELTARLAAARNVVPIGTAKPEQPPPADQSAQPTKDSHAL